MTNDPNNGTTNTEAKACGTRSMPKQCHMTSKARFNLADDKDSAVYDGFLRAVSN